MDHDRDARRRDLDGGRRPGSEHPDDDGPRVVRVYRRDHEPRGHEPRDHRTHHDRTDFSRYDVPQLRGMTESGRLPELAGAREVWDDVGGLLHDIANDLERKLADFVGGRLWTGGAAEAHADMVRTLARDVRRVAQVAWEMRESVRRAGYALHIAQRDMALHALTPGTPPEVAYGRAVRFLTTLADQYIIVADTMPDPPRAVDPHRPGRLRPGDAPLFGGMVDSGRFAAGGTVARPDALTPPPSAPGPTVPADPDPGASPGPGGSPRDAGSAGTGDFSSSGLSFAGGGLAGAGLAAARPAPSGTGLRGPSTGAMIPGMMPLGGMMGGGGDQGGGRQAPKWLIEREDVWGESTFVAPAVIGEVDAPEPDRAALDVDPGLWT